ncbi:glycosyltransferase [Candidatus Woesearchaeota archaeon]|nr:glycosyltransferase [Candidatus Woesearchaeota archaeon]
MEFSIIIPTYNRQKLLKKCLESLLHQDFPKKKYEILVIDDGSKDNTENFVKKLKKTNKNLKYFKIKKSGRGTARNLGLKNSKKKIIAFTDDDCVVEKQWLKKIEYYFKNTKVDAVGGAIVNPTNKYISWAQYILNFSAWFPKGNCKLVKDIPTANVAYRQESINGLEFSENLGKGGYEDSLFNLELRRKGGKILFCPDVKVSHFTWEMNYGLKKFFWIQKKAGLGFLLGGYKTNSKSGRILNRFKFLNLFCPRISLIFLRCVKSGYLLKFIYCFPLIFLGEFYNGAIIFLSQSKIYKN